VDTDTKYQATSKSGLEVSCVNYGELLVTTLCLKKQAFLRLWHIQNSSINSI